MKTPMETKTENGIKVNLGIENKNLSQIYNILNTVLADEYILYTKTRNFHWNVVGRDFIQLHEFFEKQYEQLNEVIDEVAERTRSLGGKSNGSLKEFADQTRLQEILEKNLNSGQMLQILLKDHETIIQELRQDSEKCEELGDMGTNDFLVGIMETHEKMAWMIRAHIE
ncbi:MAG: DNA starvation/stationary phase protection protein [Candidatus Caenarcaniphilales bacterium]|nr:DNA starvation/stationary phase protection protein [Candidatus Caenarcaniphilales bacterium]